METAQPIRIIPSGKVYRQMFDAEVQLVRALEVRDTEAEAIVETVQALAQRSDLLPVGIPVVREMTAGPGMLTERQRTWTAACPNDHSVENPILYKYYTEDVRRQQLVPESEAASDEVRGLPDVLEPAKTGSNIIERISESRRKRHVEALVDMYQELGIISTDIEPKIVAIGKCLMEKMVKNNALVDSIINRIKNDEDLLVYTRAELDTLWHEVAVQSVDRKQWLHDTDSGLIEVEEIRMQQILAVFQKYYGILEKISHLMLSDLQKVLDKESQLINQTVLGNRRCYADLNAQLKLNDIEREKRLHTAWKGRVADWKELHSQRIVAGFKEYMQGEEVLQPPQVAEILQNLEFEQTRLNAKRLELLQTLRNLYPPAATKTSVYQWNQQMIRLSDKLQNFADSYFNELYAEYERVCQRCLEKQDTVMRELIETGACTEEKAQQVINEQCLPLVGERQASFEKEMDVMNKATEEHAVAQEAQIRSLFKFCQGAAHVWDCHELGLAKQERALQAKLDECRQQHDTENQAAEAQLDIMLDQMRQDSTERGLNDKLTKALVMLDNLQSGYETFHSQQTAVVAEYPHMVREELARFDHAVCSFFTVDRKHPQTRQQEKEEMAGEISQSVEPLVSPRPPEKKPSPLRTSGKGAALKGVAMRPKDSLQSLPLAVGEVLATQKGTTFYVLTVAEEDAVQSADTGLDDERSAPYIDAVKLPAELLTELRQTIRLGFLNHMEGWLQQGIDRAHSVVAAKTEELNSELDLRLHLHRPRASRTELDVHNVRAAELVLHSERVERHVGGVSDALTQLRDSFNEMTGLHKEMTTQFKVDIHALEDIFVNATKSARLVALSSRLQEEQDGYMVRIRASLRAMRHKLDQTLQKLRESNAHFIKSFKVFSDGGNFCPEEIEVYKKQLGSMSSRIDKAEGLIMSDMEGIESKRLDHAHKITAEFQNKFKHHMVDLLFIEKVKRWLTNTQVKVKAEVAASNTQASSLAEHLVSLVRKTDACAKPSFDKETVSTDDLFAYVGEMFVECHQRAIFLDCMQVVSSKTSFVTPNVASQAHVEFAQKSPSPTVAAVVSAAATFGKASKAHDDAAVPVIQHILKTQHLKLHDLEAAEVKKDSQVNVVVHIASHAAKDSSDTRSQKSSGTGISRRNSSSRKLKSASPRPGNSKSHDSHTSLSWKSTSAVSVGSVHHRRSHDIKPTGPVYRRTVKIEKRFYVFGEFEVDGERNHFLGRVTALLRETLNGLLTAAELFYRQKRDRPITRPQCLQETFDGFVDALSEKLLGYLRQAEHYHNDCLQELRGQLQTFERLNEAVPALLLRELLDTELREARDGRELLSQQFSSRLDEWQQQRAVHDGRLRPKLGHPQQAEHLEKLCGEEEQRFAEFVAGVEEQAVTLQAFEEERAADFVQSVAALSQRILLGLDGCLTVDDVVVGYVEKVCFPPSELIRRDKGHLPLEDAIPEPPPRGSQVWLGLPRSELQLAVSGSEKSHSQAASREAMTTAAVTSAKTTLAHTACFNERNTAYQEYKRYFESCLETIEETRCQRVFAEQHYKKGWQAAVERVRQLYTA